MTNITLSFPNWFYFTFSLVFCTFVFCLGCRWKSLNEMCGEFPNIRRALDLISQKLCDLDHLKIYISLIILLIMLSGCLTYNKFVRTCEQNLQASPKNLSTKLKAKPLKTVPLSTEVEYQLYDDPLGDSYLVAYFKNNQLILYGQNNDYFHLDSKYKLGLIDKDEYRWQYQILQQEDIARQQRTLQAFGVWQGMRYQRIQQSQPTVITPNTSHHSGTITNTQTGETWRYQGTEEK